MKRIDPSRGYSLADQILATLTVRQLRRDGRAAMLCASLSSVRDASYRFVATIRHSAGNYASIGVVRQPS